jgi:hypothetical protein
MEKKRGRPHYNGRYGYYLPIKNGEIRLLNESTLKEYLRKSGMNNNDVVDDATGRGKTWE